MDGEQAISFIARAEQDASAPQPDILLLDINLPRRTGFEILESVRASRRWKDVPVLVFTSSDDPADRLRADTLNAMYFRKPPSLKEFMMLGGRIKDLLESRGLLEDDGAGAAG